MTLIIGGDKHWYTRTPFSARAKKLVETGTKVGIVQSFKDKPQLECNTCNYHGAITILETLDNFAWGECPQCKKPYVVGLL